MPTWPFILYGGDYNPEQWPPEVWDEDARLMRQAHVNVATVPVFGWVSLQPDEDTFTFDWLDAVLDKLTVQGVRACLATATASQPAWLDAKYPDVLTTDEWGRRRRHGNRHSFCPNSANFRRLSTGLARRLAERYKDHPALLLWHVGNEYGTHCYCENCAAAFRTWLQQRYGSLAALNERWYTAFWGHTYTDWAQVEPPYANGEGSIQALKLDYQRFQSASLLACYQAERDVLHEVTPGVPVTTNLMGAFFNLDYREWAREMDVVSWDSYPTADARPSDVAFSHSLMRGLREGEPFLLMEQSPSQQNWQAYNTVKAPGVLRRQSFQAMAHGADSVMYFQWRRGRGGIEKLHGAVVEHNGRPDARVFREVAELGAELESLGTRTLGGRVPARAAILFDWPNWWALRWSSGPSRDLDYVGVCRAFYAAFHALGIAVDVAAPDADLSGYDLIAAPALAMLRPADAERIERRVAEGATLLATFFTGFVDENDRVHPGGVPGPLRKVLGVQVEETDALLPSRPNGLRFVRDLPGLASGTEGVATLLCDRVWLEGAEPLAVYTAGFYSGEPALTRHAFGQGHGCYLATFPDAPTLRKLVHALCHQQGIGSPLAESAPPPDGVEVSVRVSPSGQPLVYLLNHTDEPTEVTMPGRAYVDLLSGDRLGPDVPLAPVGVRILSEE